MYEIYIPHKDKKEKNVALFFLAVNTLAAWVIFVFCVIYAYEWVHKTRYKNSGEVKELNCK